MIQNSYSMIKSGAKAALKLTKIKSQPLLKRDESIKELHLETLNKPKCLLMVHYRDKRLSIPIFEECTNGEAFITKNLSRFEQEILGSKSLNNLKDIVGYRTSDRDVLKDYYFTLGKDVTIFKLLELEPIWKAVQASRGLDNYEFHRCLHRGKWSKVYMVRHKASGEFHAIKLTKKSGLSEAKIDMVRNEESSLRMVSHPFVMGLVDSFETEKHIVLVTEYCHGGSLEEHLQKQQKLSEMEVKFYTLELMMAVGKLHEAKIAHQDIQLSSLLLDFDGHLRLSGFGRSSYRLMKKGNYKEDQKNTSEKEESGFMFDYYCIGALGYQLLFGYSSPNKYIPSFPSNTPISNDAKSFLKELMYSNPNGRLGSLGGVKEILNHEWLRNSNLERLVLKGDCAPIQPNLLSFPSDIEVDKHEMKSYEREHQVYPEMLPVSMDSESEVLKPMKISKQINKSMNKCVTKSTKKELKGKSPGSKVIRKTSNKKITINIQIMKKREVETASRTLMKNKSETQLSIKHKLKRV